MQQQDTVIDSMTNMSCVCCLSGRTSPRPLGLEGYSSCLNCGLMFKVRVEGQNPEDSLISHYEDADPHEMVAALKQSFFNYTLDHLSSQISENNKKSILDVGCGFGYFLELAAQKGWVAHGVEIAKGAVEDARDRVGNENIFHGILKEAKYSDYSFDAITLWDVLVHVENPFEELRECYRLLKDGGKIGIRVRNVAFQKRAYQVYSSLKKINPQLSMKGPYVFHRYCFSSKSIYQLLSRLGFTNIKVVNSPLTKGDPYGYDAGKWLVMALKSLIGFISRFVFWVTGGRMVIGPSLLVWADKPKTDWTKPDHASFPPRSSSNHF